MKISFSFICKVELISITKTSHLDSLWRGGRHELGNSLLQRWEAEMMNTTTAWFTQSNAACGALCRRKFNWTATFQMTITNAMWNSTGKPTKTKASASAGKRHERLHDLRRGRQRERHQTTIWLVKRGKKFSCCTLHNNDVKSPNLRFWRQRERTNATLSFSIFTLKPLVPIYF